MLVRRLLSSLVALVALAPPGTAFNDPVVLENVTIYDGNGAAPISNGIIVVENGRLRCVGDRQRCPIPEEATRVDLSGHFVTPGLVDAHVHFSQTGWLDGRPDSPIGRDFYDYEALQQRLRENPDRWHRAYLCSGITAVYDVGGFHWTTSYDAVSENHAERTHVRAAGPLITHADVPYLRALGEDQFLPMDSDAEALESVGTLVDWGAKAVKVWYLDPPEDRQAELDERLGKIGNAARENGLPLIVHATQLRNAKVALRAGARMLVHSVMDEPVDDEFLALARAAGTVYAPTLVVSENWTRAVVSASLGLPYPIDDPNGCVDAETRSVLQDAPRLQEEVPEPFRTVDRQFARLGDAGYSRALLAQNLMRVYEAGIPIATATDAGNPLTLHGPSIYAELEAMERAGIPADRLIVLSTHNGADVMGRLDDFGTLEEGKIADLVVLDEDPGEKASAFRSITHVMRKGVLREVSYFSSADR